MISAARPKIADYHFTTLQPNLGVVFVSEGSSFVCADIPGIIEGAAQGAGLGHDFLRHIERCRLLVHLVDAAGSEGRDPVEDLNTINRELHAYSETLAARPQIIVANKCDLIPEGSDNLARLEARAAELGFPLFRMSAALNQGVRELVYRVWQELEKLPLICLEKNTSTRACMDRFLYQNHVEMHPEFELATSDMIVQFALRNLGVGCVMREFAKEQLESGRLFELRFNKIIPRRHICVLTEKRKPLSKAAEGLFEMLQKDF